MNRSVAPLTAALVMGALLAAACGGGGAPAAPTTAPKTDTKAAAPGTSGAPASSPAAAGKSAPASGKATGEPIKVGVLCDRSGAVAAINTYLCDGMEDWWAYLNADQGGAKGRPIEYSEIDTKYEVPLGVDGYKKMTSRENIRMVIPLATPLVDALAPLSKEDKVVMWSPGFGLSNAADAKEFPYIFVGVATYKAQGMAAMQAIADEWKALGKTGNPKVTYVFYDNPAGRDPLDLIKGRSKELGIDIIDTVPVPATTVDMTTIMTQVKDKNPDYAITHLFGRTPALSLQAAEKIGFPRDKMISLVWGLAEDEVKVAQQAAEGYRGLQFAAHPNDNPEAYKLLEGWWQSSGKQPNPKARESLHYARGMMMGGLMAEAARLSDNPMDGDSLKKGIETMKDFTANGLLAGTTLSPEDHGGTRKVRMYQVKGGKLVQTKDWFEGPKP